jgi:methyl-accepting chemotaxis protein
MTEAILVIILAVQTVTIISIAIILLWTMRKLARSMDTIRPIIEDLGKRAGGVLEGIQETAEKYRSIGMTLGDVSNNIREISGSVKHVAYDMNEVVEEATFRAVRQIAHADRMCRDALEKSRRIMDTLSDSVLPPILELSAVLKGVEAAFRYIMKRK